MLFRSERVWGQDAAFLRQHGEVYQELRKSFRLARASCLLHQGLTREAREELDLAGGSPFSHRLLAMLPGGIVRPLLNLRIRLRGIAP